MKSSQLKAIRARARNASPGPWVQWSGHTAIKSSPPDAPVTLNTPGRMHGGAVDICEMDEDFNDNWENDAKFIAKARTDVPALLKEVATLTRERDELRVQQAELVSIIASTVPLAVAAKCTVIAQDLRDVVARFLAKPLETP